MMFTLAAESNMLVSLAKPLMLLIMFVLWGRWASVVDRDANYFYMPRHMWNGIQLLAAAVALFVALVIPWFWAGFPLALLILIGGGLAYVRARNAKVPKNLRWDLSPSAMLEAIKPGMASRGQQPLIIEFMGKGLEPESQPEITDPAYATHQLLDRILGSTLLRGGQRIDLAVNEEQAVIVQGIDGVGHRMADEPPRSVLELIDYLKKHAGLDTENRRKKQIGTTRIRMGDEQHEIKVRTAGSTRGITCQIIFDVEEQLTWTLDEIGFNESQRQQVEQLAGTTDGGVVFVAAERQQGSTTTLYTLLDKQDPYTSDIRAIELERERAIEGVTSTEVDSTAAMADELHKTLLMDPNVVMVPLVTEPKTMQVMAKGAADGKRIYAGLRISDGLNAAKLWLEGVNDRELAAKTLKAIIVQKLARKLCPDCKVAYEPDANVLKRLNLSAEQAGTLYKAGGTITNEQNENVECPTCGGLGFYGRTGIFEVMLFDDQARQYLVQGDMDALRLHLRKQNTTLLQEAALQKVAEGITSVKEVLRVLPSSSDTSGGRK